MSSLFSRRLRNGLRALGFVVVTLVAWWLFASMSENIVSCVPWGRPWGSCEPLSITSGAGSPASGKPLTDRTRNALLIVSLLPSLWVAQRMFYSSDELDDVRQSDKDKTTGRGPVGIHKDKPAA